MKLFSCINPQTSAKADALRRDVLALKADAQKHAGTQAQGKVNFDQVDLTAQSGRRCRNPYKPLPEVLPDLVVSRDPLYLVSKSASGELQLSDGTVTQLHLGDGRESLHYEETQAGWFSRSPRQVFRREAEMGHNYLLRSEAVYDAGNGRLVSFHEDCGPKP